MDRLRLPATLESLDQFQSFVADRALASGLAPAAMSKVELVIEELLVNHAMHAYRGQSGDSEVHCQTRDDGAFCLDLIDWGPAFDPLYQPPPDLSLDLDERPIGGLGIHLVRHLTDHLEYRRDADRNILTVCFEPA